VEGEEEEHLDSDEEEGAYIERRRLLDRGEHVESAPRMLPQTY